jgi:hypothetical protein
MRGGKMLYDLTNQRYGRLIVLSRSTAEHKGATYWDCLCDCGKTNKTSSYNLRKGLIVSCGCYRNENTGNVHRRHGLKGTKTYNCWRNMMDRCTNPNTAHWNDYGGRGITIAPEWKDFGGFYKDMGDKPIDKSTLERLDVNKGYSKENCIWADWLTQANNKRNNVRVEYAGKTQTLSEWGRELNLSLSLISYRHKQGWPVEEIFHGKKFKYTSKKLAELEDMTGFCMVSLSLSNEEIK